MYEPITYLKRIGNSSVSLIDNRYSNLLMFLSWYIFYLTSTMVALSDGQIPIIPNIFISLVYLIFSFLHIVLHTLHSGPNTKKYVISIFLLAVNPALLLSVTTFGWIRNKRKSGVEMQDLLGPGLLIITGAVLTPLIFFTFYLFILYDPIPYHPLYLLSLLMFWSVLPISLSIFNFAEFKSQPWILLQKNTSVRKSSNLISLTILFLMMIITSPQKYPPVGIPWR